MSIIRTVHNKENPYVQINKAALWDKNLSLEAAGLWARLLSRPNNWRISVSELCKSCDSSESRIYRILKELIDNGYAFRYQVKGAGSRFEKLEYLIFESKTSINEIKEILPHLVFPDAETPHAENRGTTNIDSTKEREEPISFLSPLRGDCQEAEPPDDSEPPPLSRTSKESQEAAELLLKKVLEVHPKFKKPSIQKWAQVMDKLNRIDKRSWEDVKSLIEWAFEDSFWSSTLQSPEGLRRNWDKLVVKMKPPENKGNREKWNRIEAREAESHLNKTNRPGLMVFLSDRIVNKTTNESVSFGLPFKEFIEEMCRVFNLRKK